MAAQLPRPGIEIVQEFRSASPTIVQPTLVPCNIAPFFEIIEVLNADGTANANAKLSTQYLQLGLTILQNAFPSPRGNIDQVDVNESSVRVFFQFGGKLLELSRTAGFLTPLDVSTKPFCTGTQTGPFNLDGRRLIVSFDAHTAVANGAATPGTSHFPVSADIPIVFEADAMTITEVVDFINGVIPGVASEDTGALKLSSTKYGAGASVLVRPTGSANAILGFSAVDAQVAVGHGFFSADDSDGDNTSPRIEEFLGTLQRNIGNTNVPDGSSLSFITFAVQPGDTVVADGVNIGEVQAVLSNRMTMEVEQNIMSSSVRFAPRRVWVQANNLSFPAPDASAAATLTGTNPTAVATQAYIVGNAAGTYAIGAAETFDVTVLVGGVALATESVSSGAGWANLAAAVAGINATSGIHFEAYFANAVGDEVPSAIAQRLGLRTLANNTGAGAGITLESQTTGMTLGFTASLPVSDVGEAVRYLKGTPAIKTSTLWVGGTGATAAQTVIYAVLVGGSVPTGAPETIIWGASHANNSGGIDAAVADWNAKALYTEAYRSTSAGVALAAGTYLSIRTRGENLGVDASVQVTGGTAVANFPVDGSPHVGVATDLNGAVFKWSLDLNPKVYSTTFITTEDDDGVSLQSVLNAINEVTPGIATESAASPPALILTSGKVGIGSQVLVGDGTANNFSTRGGLGFTDNQADVGAGRPVPDLAIDVNGHVLVQSQILRNGLTGTPFNPGLASIYIAYKGLRLDVSPAADKPGLLTLNGPSAIQELVSPISSDNPGALMCFLSSLNAPGTAITAIGVPEISADAPSGTPLGYARCFQFLESEEVYAIATASQLGVVHQAGLTHVNYMSEPEQKGERIYFFNPTIPDRALPTLIGSGTDANSTVTEGEITLDANIAPALIEQGIDPNSAINPATGAIAVELYLDLGADDRQYLIAGVTNGTTLALRSVFATGDGNSDSFYATVFPTPVISDNWAVKIRGSKLVIPGSTTEDKDKTAETIQKTGQAYGFRRGFMTFPDQCAINVSGLEELVPGFYADAAIVGMVAGRPPQQGFTNFPMTGLTRVVGSNDRYTEKQLNVMAAGGTYILVQDAEGAPVVCRHQLSTDLKSIEVRELSITKVVDFTAKFLRTGLRNFIGRSNITQPFLDQLGTVVHGLGSFLTENGVLIGFDVSNLIQDADAPDTILIDAVLDVPFPCNFIRLTLAI